MTENPETAAEAAVPEEASAFAEATAADAVDAYVSDDDTDLTTDEGLPLVTEIFDRPMFASAALQSMNLNTLLNQSQDHVRSVAASIADVCVIIADAMVARMRG